MQIPQKKKTPINYYFTDETEKAIEKYNNAKTQNEKNIIYKKYLDYPFKKLIENVIHSYKLYNTGITYNNLFDHILEYLIEKLYKIDLSQGKAYSYLTVTARNYGFMLTNNNHNKAINQFDTDDCYELDDVSYIKHERQLQQDSLSEFFDIFSKYMRKNLNVIFNDKEEIQIADVLLEFFEKRHDIDIFNKKALYIIIREKIKNCEARFITNVNKILKENFYRMYNLYQKNGLKDFKYYSPIKRPLVNRRNK
jgi:hypothetical protein